MVLSVSCWELWFFLCMGVCTLSNDLCCITVADIYTFLFLISLQTTTTAITAATVATASRGAASYKKNREGVGVRRLSICGWIRYTIHFGKRTFWLTLRLRGGRGHGPFERGEGRRRWLAGEVYAPSGRVLEV